MLSPAGQIKLRELLEAARNEPVTVLEKGEPVAVDGRPGSELLTLVAARIGACASCSAVDLTGTNKIGDGRF
jgi:hypothetical protein